MRDFVKALHSPRVLLMDGAMGTQLQCAGITEAECCEAWNLSQPEKVRAIHQAYVAAGAEVLLANTFQANPPALTRHHQEENLTAIIETGLAHARLALPRKGWVLADIGPMSTTELKTIWPVLNACGAADGILLETFSDPGEAALMMRANKSGLGPKKPCLVSFTFDGKTGNTFQDSSPEKCAGAAVEMGAAALGINCGRNLDVAACAAILKRFRAVTAMPLFARINAGTPSAAREYPHAPDDMAAHLPELLQAGAIMVGGCCGTTPRHIERFRACVDAWNKNVPRSK